VDHNDIFNREANTDIVTPSKSRNSNLGKFKTTKKEEKRPIEHTQTLKPTTGTSNFLAMYMTKGNFQSLRELKENA